MSLNNEVSQIKQKSSSQINKPLEKDFSQWDSFVSKVTSLDEEKEDIKRIKHILKIKEKVFPSNNFMIKYFN